jgi:nucleotide sugar dehydrogenase
MGLCFEKVGYHVICYDINETIVNAINNKSIESYEENVSSMLSKSTNITATTNLIDVLSADVIFIVVQTPSISNGAYDHSYINDVVAKLSTLGKQDQKKHLVISCTTMPEYCDTVHETLKEYNYEVSYNPEFIAQGTIIKNMFKPDMVLIGEASEEAGDVIQNIYEKVCRTEPKICRMTRTEAEITKIALNSFITMKIAFANMIGDLVDSVNGNPDTVLQAIGSDSRVGDKCLKYGYGFGGPCFPRDNRALTFYGTYKSIKMELPIATDSSNYDHLVYQLKKERSLNKHLYTFECITYKPESIIIEESQKLKLAEELVKCGAKVLIKERPIVIEMLKEKYGDKFTYENI